jgi:hypothetical protein
MTCGECRQRMSSDDLLNRLRCANCRQIKFDQFYDFTLMILLIASAEFIGWLMFSRSHD